MSYESVSAKHIGDAVYLIGCRTFTGEVEGNMTKAFISLTSEEAVELAQQLLDEAGKIK